MQEDFDSWFYKLESFGLRCERFYEDIAISDLTKRSTIACKWLEAAFNQGVQSVENHEKIIESQISIICYANVSGMFADFHDMSITPKKNFSWVKFPEMCARLSSTWIALNGLESNEQSTEIAAKYSREIATTLCERAGYF
jgi:hypothetical protein